MTTQHILAAAFTGILTLTAVTMVGAADRIRIGAYEAPEVGDQKPTAAPARPASKTVDSHVFRVSDHWAAKGW